MKKLIPVIIFFLTISCEKKEVSKRIPVDEIRKVDFDYNEFQLNKNKWENLHISDYSFTHTSSGFGCFSNNYIVKNYMVIEAKPDTQFCRMSLDTTKRYTIDNIFMLIEDHYHGTYSVSYDIYLQKIKVAYDSVYFFPKVFEFTYFGIEDLDNVQSITNFKIE